MKMEKKSSIKLSKAQKEALERYRPIDWIHDDLKSLEFLENSGFGGFTISQMIDVLLNYFNENRG